MALSQVYTAVAGHVITAARWNNEFGNIYANGTDLAFPLTKAVSLSGYTLTIDAAGVTTLSSSTAQAFVFAPGSKSGTPGVNGSFFNFAAGTFTDSNTAVSGTAAFWSGTTFRIPTLNATNATVTTADACTVYIEGAPTQGTNETFSESSALFVDGQIKCSGNFRLRGIDTRTNSIVEPATIQMMTSGTPANGIGIGIAFKAESQDEAPSDAGTLDFEFTDITAASEDTRMRITTRVAGAALAETYSWQAFGAFSGKFEHTNTAARTYTLPDFTARLVGGAIYNGPSSTGTGSNEAHEGTVTISADQAMQGTHYYTDFTLNATKTLTLADGSQRLIIVATGTITINGTIDAIGAGGLGAAGSTILLGNAVEGGPGLTNGGGGGGSANNAGSVGSDGGRTLLTLGGRGGQGAAAGGGQAANMTGDIAWCGHPLAITGGGGGGGGGATNVPNAGGPGGNGGGSIVLIAPNVVLGSASVLNTSGAAGAAGAATTAGAGGGGSAGGVFIFCVSYTNNGATFTMAGGAGGTSGGAGGAGGAGRDGVKQINIYA